MDWEQDQWNNSNGTIPMELSRLSTSMVFWGYLNINGMGTRNTSRNNGTDGNKMEQQTPVENTSQDTSPPVEISWKKLS